MIPAAPRFWWDPRPAAAATALRPLAALYGAAAGRRMAGTGAGVGVPVVCVGNFVVGGAGKTPVALEIARHLTAAGQDPAFVSRGYGGRGAPRGAPFRVEPDRHGAREAGDEPLLLARVAPCFVARDRLSAARAAAAAGATVVLMDDGLQNPALDKDLGIAVVDGAVGVGNGLCLPAGPLRAPMGAQWRAIGLVVVVGPGRPGDVLAADAAARRIPVQRAAFEADERALAALRGRRLVAFSGIARPAKFFATLDEAGLDVAERIGFPDHHPYSARDRDRLLRAAAAAGGGLVTTEKDRVRLPPGFPADTLPVRLRFDDEAPLEDLLGALIGGG